VQAICIYAPSRLAAAVGHRPGLGSLAKVVVSSQHDDSDSDITPSAQEGQKKNRVDFLFMVEPDIAHTEARRLHLGTASGSDWTPPPPGGGQRTSMGAYCTQAYGVRKSES
jgi:hypothetical protein